MGARILVADDSVTIQKVVELTFSREDFVLAQARSGEEAIRQAKETRPDLVLLDLLMPDMNGYDVCAALRADPALRSVPIILLAGTFESFDHQRAARAGANDFVTKPFESHVLVGKVKQLLFAKAMEAGSAGAAAKSAAGAVTVTIAPGAAAARVSVPQPADIASQAEPPSSPAAPPIPAQDELWQLLSDPSEPTPAAAQPSERSVAPPAASSGPPPAPTQPEHALDLGTPELESIPPEVLSAAEAMDELPLPESLSLDDLLAVGAEGPPRSLAGEPATADTDTPEPEPVFDLSDVAANPLPMVEAGKGEAPALSVDDLLGPAGEDTAPADTLTMELPAFDLTPLPEADAPAMADIETAPPAVPHVEQMTGEIALQGPGDAVMDAVEFAPAGAGTGFELETRESAPAAEALGTPVEEIVSEPAASTLAVPVADASAPVAPIEVPPPDMAAMREAVTAQVASDLRRELSEKLLDRFEKIVWEVVPDLAEILIAKEIERIRRLAEEEKS